MCHAIFAGFPSAGAANVEIQGLFPVEKIILRVDRELEKSGYQKKSEPNSVQKIVQSNRYRFTLVKYISPISVGGATEKQIRSNKKQFQLPRGTKI